MRQGDFFKTLKDIIRRASVNFVTFVVLEISDNLFTMQNSLNVTEISKISKTVDHDARVWHSCCKIDYIDFYFH